ncbi:MAG: MlaD family protein [bacterium]
MEYKANEIKAGLLIVCSIVILFVFLAVIFGTSWGENTKEYITYLENVPGIQNGSLVKYGGMDVGFVTEVNLPKNGDTRIGLRLKVDEKTPVRVDSKAFVTSIGIMADQHIEISPGSVNSTLLPSGSILESKEVLGFSQMAEPMGELTGQMQEMMDRVLDILNEENRAHLSSMMASLDTMLIGGQTQFVKLVGNMENLTANLAHVSGDLNKLMEDNKATFDETLGHLQNTTKETGELITDLRQTLALFDKMLSSNSTSLVNILENFQFASQNLEEFTRMVKERPWLLVRKAAPPQRKMP